MATLEELLKDMNPEVKARLDLIGAFQDKFGKSPMVDPDLMPQSVWVGLMKQAVETGEIPPTLADKMGFVTSIREG